MDELLIDKHMVKQNLYVKNRIDFPCIDGFDVRLPERTYPSDKIKCCGKRLNDCDCCLFYLENPDFCEFTREDFYVDCDDLKCYYLIDDYDCEGFFLHTWFTITRKLLYRFFDGNPIAFLTLYISFNLILSIASLSVSIFLCDSFPSTGYLQKIPDGFSWAIYIIHHLGFWIYPEMFIITRSYKSRKKGEIETSLVFLLASNLVELIGTCLDIVSTTGFHIAMLVEFFLLFMFLLYLPSEIVQRGLVKEIFHFFFEASILSVGYRGSTIYHECLINIPDLMTGAELTVYNATVIAAALLVSFSGTYGSIITFSIFYAGTCIGTNSEFQLTKYLSIQYIPIIFTLNIIRCIFHSFGGYSTDSNHNIVNSVYRKNPKFSLVIIDNEFSKHQVGVRFILISIAAFLFDLQFNINIEYSCYTYIVTIAFLICAVVSLIYESGIFQICTFGAAYLAYICCVCLEAPNGNAKAGLVITQISHSLIFVFYSIGVGFFLQEYYVTKDVYVMFCFIAVCICMLCFNLNDIPGIVIYSLGIIVVLIIGFLGVFRHWLNKVNEQCAIFVMNCRKLFCFDY